MEIIRELDETKHAQTIALVKFSDLALVINTYAPAELATYLNFEYDGSTSLLALQKTK